MCRKSSSLRHHTPVPPEDLCWTPSGSRDGAKMNGSGITTPDGMRTGPNFGLEDDFWTESWGNGITRIV